MIMVKFAQGTTERQAADIENFLVKEFGDEIEEIYPSIERNSNLYCLEIDSYTLEADEIKKAIAYNSTVKISDIYEVGVNL